MSKQQQAQNNDDGYDFEVVTADDAATAIEEAKQARSADDKYMSLSAGDNFIRLIPLAKGMKGYGPSGKNTFALRFVHYVKDGTKTVRALCSRLTHQQACAACDYIKSATANGVQFNEDPTPKLEVVYNVIDRANELAGPRLLRCGPMLHEILQERARKAPRVYDPRSSGVDLIITKKGTGRDTRYDVSYDMEGTRELGDPAWLQQQHDLNAECAPDDPTEIVRRLSELQLSAPRASTNNRPPPIAANVTQPRGAIAAGAARPQQSANRARATQPVAAGRAQDIADAVIDDDDVDFK